MQLNEILEENSIKTISQKTKISDTNLEALFEGDFTALQKTKALGFIAIVEREYHADLSALREEALEYYSANREESNYTTRHYLDEEKKGKSKLFVLVVLALLIYASWYFLTQFDKNNLSGLIPFIDEEKVESFLNDNEAETASDLSIVTVTTKENTAPSQPESKKEVSDNAGDVSALVASLVDETTETEAIESVESISIVPAKKLWFGLVNIETKEREHFSIEKPYALDIRKNSWLVATSSAPFSLVDGEKKEAFDDAKEHYFKIDKNGIEVLSKSEYVEQGGWHRW